jgi:hypothetical protein
MAGARPLQAAHRTSELFSVAEIRSLHFLRALRRSTTLSAICLSLIRLVLVSRAVPRIFQPQNDLDVGLRDRIGGRQIAEHGGRRFK